MKQLASTQYSPSAKQSVTTKQNQEINNRVQHAQLKILDVIEATLEGLTHKSKSINPPVPVFRRQIANMIALWKSCPQNRCRRSHCCRGEPLHCLCIAFPLITEDSPLFEMLKKGERVHSPKRSRKQVKDVLTESLTNPNSSMQSLPRILPMISGILPRI